VFFGFVSVKFAINFYYSHLYFKVDVFNEFNDYWYYIIDFYFFLNLVEMLKVNSHKRKKVVQVRNLFLVFEILLIFHVLVTISLLSM
jgi:hypothetical protein